MQQEDLNYHKPPIPINLKFYYSLFVIIRFCVVRANEYVVKHKEMR